MTVESTSGLAPLVKRVSVRLTPERAFALFTDRIAEWWPLRTHSVYEQHAATVRFSDGRLIESTPDGRRDVWGSVMDWEPPARLRMSWHPGRTSDEATIVEVTFIAAGEETVVTLTHSGWAGRDDGRRARTGYDTGWVTVLDRFAAVA